MNIFCYKQPNVVIQQIFIENCHRSSNFFVAFSNKNKPKSPVFITNKAWPSLLNDLPKSVVCTVKFAFDGETIRNHLNKMCGKR